MLCCCDAAPKPAFCGKKPDPVRIVRSNGRFFPLSACALQLAPPARASSRPVCQSRARDKAQPQPASTPLESRREETTRPIVRSVSLEASTRREGGGHSGSEGSVPESVRPLRGSCSCERAAACRDCGSRRRVLRHQVRTSNMWRLLEGWWRLQSAVFLLRGTLSGVGPIVV